MDYRPLGRTGVSVSQLCLGAMMFGAVGNPDHDDSIAMIHRALDAGRQLHRHRRRLLRRRVRGDRRQGARRRTTRRRRARDEGRPAVRRGPQPARNVATVDHGGGRGLAATAGDRLDRPLPDPSPRSDRRRRRDPRRAVGPRPCGQDPRLRRLDGRPPRRSSRPSGPPSAAAASGFAPSSRPYSLLTRAVEHDVLPTCLRHGMGVLTYSPLAGGWLSGQYRKGRPIAGPGSAARRQLFANRYDASRGPSTSASSMPPTHSARSPTTPA